MTPASGSREVKLTGDLGSWDVHLAGGEILHLAAHAYSREEDEYVFVALADGIPPFEVELARVPVGLVARIIGG